MGEHHPGGRGSCRAGTTSPLSRGSAGASPSRITAALHCWLIAIATLCVSATLFAQPNQPSRAMRRQPVGQMQVAPALAPVQNAPANNADNGWPAGFQPEKLVEPEGLSGTLNLMLLLTVLSLAPSILMMTTCFVRFVVVLGILRQALGTQSLPPNQVIISLCLFLTFLVMAPVWRQSYDEGIKPYTDPQPGEAISLREAVTRTTRPLARYMSHQIERSGNTDVVWMLVEHQRPPAGSPGAENWQPPKDYEELSPEILLPAYLLSELKTAFLIGFQIFLPFLIIDMVVSAVLMSMGMAMLPPTVVSLPFKLLLFVLIDGWGLTVGMLLESVR